MKVVSSKTHRSSSSSSSSSNSIAHVTRTWKRGSCCPNLVPSHRRSIVSVLVNAYITARESYFGTSDGGVPGTERGKYGSDHTTSNGRVLGAFAAMLLGARGTIASQFNCCCCHPHQHPLAHTCCVVQHQQTAFVHARALRLFRDNHQWQLFGPNRPVCRRQ